MSFLSQQGEAHKKMGVPSFRVRVEVAPGRFMLSPRYLFGVVEQLVKELGNPAALMFDPE
jgi:hypothetical protein